MDALAVADPAALGFDAGRLQRIDRLFDRYVADGRLPGWLALVLRDGQVAHVGCSGSRDLEAGLPVEHDTLWRIYSMTKPVTAVAAMMLWEEGAFELKSPIATWLPEWGEARVFRGGTALKPVTDPQIEPIRVWHLLTHTAGMTYGFHHVHPVDAMYRKAGFEWGTPPGVDLAGCSERWAALPLVHQPGAEWNYSVATDVLGRLVEVVSGMPLDAFFAERILRPLGMHDTGFSAREDQLGRLAALYSPDPATGRARRSDALGAVARSRPDCLSGGGGLVSTAADYARFASFLLGEGELDGIRLLGSRTVRFMSVNHLPGGADLEAFGRPLFSETTFDGVGFGLGLSVTVDPVAGKVPASRGEVAWGGAASTAFWVDPAERICALFFTQLLPSSTYPVRTQMRQMVMQALVD
jgi:CubicO group peptidase (beta-lactamase class C family)